MQVIRGAITAECNEKQEILQKTKEMLQAIVEKNEIAIANILSIQFTATHDLTAVYPAVAARDLGITKAALLCMQELFVEGSLKMCIRCGVMVDTDKKQGEAIAVYLGGASVLRPDLATKDCYAIAIDGPAGSGKSSAAKEIAKCRGLIYVDTGAMYRAVGLYCLQQGIDLENEEQVSKALHLIELDFKGTGQGQAIFLNGEDVTQKVRTQEAGKAASWVATMLPVRQKLVDIQRELAKGNNVVMDGRDIGTHVLPHALVKLYVDASVEERAKRRCHELEKLGQRADFLEVSEQISKRDEADKGRQHNPLTQAADAILVDTSQMDLEKVIETLLTIIDKKIQN